MQFPRKPLAIFLSLATLSLLYGCGSSPNRSGQTTTVHTGRIISAQPVTLQSQAGGAALTGAVVGNLATSSSQSSSRRARNTFIGAATGAAISGASQGSLSGMRYTVQIRPGTSIQVTSNQTEMRVGDCVTVEQRGSTSNLRRISSYLCAN